jgi:hypothetical protein
MATRDSHVPCPSALEQRCCFVFYSGFRSAVLKPLPKKERATKPETKYILTLGHGSGELRQRHAQPSPRLLADALSRASLSGHTNQPREGPWRRWAEQEGRGALVHDRTMVGDTRWSNGYLGSFVRA